MTKACWAPRTTAVRGSGKASSGDRVMSRLATTMVSLLVAGVSLMTVVGCTNSTSGNGSATSGPATSGSATSGSANGPATSGSATSGSATSGSVNGPATSGGTTSGPTGTQTAQGVARVYPQHTDVVATTFWVGEIFDPNASDGSQVVSTYDSQWLAHYGGCDGVVVNGDCQTQVRTSANGFFPTSMTPQENPFYLDLPFDDVNDPGAFARRASVIPWADDPGYAGRANDPSFSYMKNRWVEITKGSQTCYAQIEDAGPGEYDDAEYVFGTDNQRPKNTEFNSAGMDVSPAVNGCLGFSDVNGDDDRVDWRFVEETDVPPGPWRTLISTSPVTP